MEKRERDKIEKREEKNKEDIVLMRKIQSIE